MEEAYIRSLQMIKVLKIKNEEEYKKLLHTYLILNLQSLKYVAQQKKFKEIIKLAKEV